MRKPHERAACAWIERLQLTPHPEGGWYRQTYLAPLVLPQAALPGHSGDRAASTAIYFLLAGDQFSAFHRLRSDEMWHFYSGSELVVHVIDPMGTYRQIRLGSDPASGQHFQAVVTAGCWFGSSLREKDSFALVGCTVAPGFEFAMAQRKQLTAEYPQHYAIIEQLTRN